MARWLNRLHLRGKLAFILIVGFVLPMTLLTVLMVDRLLTDNREARIQEMQRSMEHRRDQLDALCSRKEATGDRQNRPGPEDPGPLLCACPL